MDQLDAKVIEQIPCPLCKAMIRSQQSFVKQYMELCEHCKNKFALKFCVCKKPDPAYRRQEKYATTDHKERQALRDRGGVDKNWIKLSSEQKMLEKDEIFYKNMYDFFRQFPPCARKVPKYKIKPLLDDRLYGNVEDFFRKIGPSPSYASVHRARYDEHASFDRDESESYKYYDTDQGIADQHPLSERHSFGGASAVMDDQYSVSGKREYYGTSPITDESRGPVADKESSRVITKQRERQHNYYSGPENESRGLVADKESSRVVTKQRERQHKYYSGPEKDEHRLVVEIREKVHTQYRDRSADDHHQVLETTERHYEHFKGEPVARDDLRISEKHERHRKYYSGPIVVGDHRTISERPSEYRGPVRDRPRRVIETHESTQKRYHGGPVMDDHRRVSERHERHETYQKSYDDSRETSGRHAGSRPGAAKGFAKQYKLHSGADMEDQRPSVERHRRQYREGPAIDDPERQERRQKDFGGGRRELSGRPQKQSTGPSSDEHRSIGSTKGYAKAIKLYGGRPLAAQTEPDLKEESGRRKADKTQKGYVSEPDTMAASSSPSKKKVKKKEDDNLLLVHDQGNFKYAEKSPAVEKFKNYSEQVKEQQKKEKDQEGGKWGAVAEKKKAFKSKIREKVKSEGDSQKSKEGVKKGKSDQKQDGREIAIEREKKKEKRVSKDTDEAFLKKLQSNEGIVPLTEAALHLEDLDRRTSEKQARMIEERLKELATIKRKKPIIRDLIRHKKKSPRVRVGSYAYFARLNSSRNLLERRRKENIEPKIKSELDLLNVSSAQDLDSIIIGPKLYRYRPPLKESGEPNIYDPLIHKVMPVLESKLEFTPPPEPMQKGRKSKTPEEPAPVKTQPDTAITTDWEDHTRLTDQLTTEGIISYALSDRYFIDKGWSKLPTEHVVRRMDLYRMRPPHSYSDWFERNKANERMLYESGEKFAEFNNETGRCRIFYKSGKIALDHYKCEEPLSQKRIVIYSKADPCSPIARKSILAIFDYLGNGVVFDHKGKIRLKFNQTEGIVLDKSLGPCCHWEWHSLNDPPELKQIMVDTNLIYKDQSIYKIEDKHNVPKRPVDEAVHEIELDNMVKEKQKKMTLPYKRFPIRIKSVKINDQFTLLIVDQASIYIKFKEGSTFFKTNIGLVLDQNEIVDTVTEKLGTVMNSVERRPAPTESLAALQRTVMNTQRLDKRAKLRDRKLNRPADHNAELDRKMTLLSKPFRKVPP